jgi:hypothetical protein
MASLVDRLSFVTYPYARDPTVDLDPLRTWIGLRASGGWRCLDGERQHGRMHDGQRKAR